MKIFNAKSIASQLTLALSFTCLNGYAGDMGPVEEPEFWAGAYVGIHAGSGAGHIRQRINDHSEEISNNFSPTTTNSFYTIIEGFSELQGHVTGSLANLFIGYNYHHLSSSLVFGGQLEGTLFSDVLLKGYGARTFFSNAFAINNGVVGPSTITNYHSNTEDSDELSSTFNFILRGGYLPCDNTLIYILGGVVAGHFVRPDAFEERLLDPSFTAIDTNIGQNSNRGLWRAGGTAGVGVEYKFSPCLSLLAEYRYMAFNYKRISDVHSDLTQGIPTTTLDTFDLNKRVSTRLNYSLGQIGIVYRIPPLTSS